MRFFGHSHRLPRPPWCAFVARTPRPGRHARLVPHGFPGVARSASRARCALCHACGRCAVPTSSVLCAVQLSTDPTTDPAVMLPLPASVFQGSIVLGSVCEAVLAPAIGGKISVHPALLAGWAGLFVQVRAPSCRSLRRTDSQATSCCPLRWPSMGTQRAQHAQHSLPPWAALMRATLVL